MRLRILGKNALTYGMGNIAARAGGFILIPLYTHALAISDYGVLATATVVIQILALCMDLGARASIIRFTEEGERRSETQAVIGTALAINITGAVVVSVVVMSIVGGSKMAGLLKLPPRLIPLILLAAAAQSLFQNLIAYYRAKNNAMRFVVPSLLLVATLLILSWYLIISLHRGIFGAVEATVGANGLLSIVVAAMVISHNGLGISRHWVRELTLYGLPVVVVMSGNLVTDAACFYYMGHYRRLSDVAIYSLGSKLAEVCSVLLIIPFQSAYEPFVFSSLGSPQLIRQMSKLFTYVLLAFAFLSCAVSCGTSLFINILAPRAYAQSYVVMLLLLPGVGFRAVYYFGEVLVHSVKKTRITASIIGGSTIVSVIAGRLLIPTWGLYGATMVSVLTSGTIAFLVMRKGLQNCPVLLDSFRIALVSGLFAVFLIVSLLFHASGFWVTGPILLISAAAGALLLRSCGFFDEDPVLAVSRFCRRQIAALSR